MIRTDWYAHLTGTVAPTIACIIVIWFVMHLVWWGVAQPWLERKTEILHWYRTRQDRAYRASLYLPLDRPRGEIGRLREKLHRHREELR